ncbi:hypothetical protein [uncultured Desulfobacter sp.]|uniref:hypothetical protein n=1 Tax=uncultured Desulfobacter sp. TaxID=240139 RepID=UPI002AA7A252|nr:hypothetical protein [uncultured Desulfobacter sp.]
MRARRIVVLKKDVKKNQAIDDSIIDYVWPGIGIPPDMADVIMEKRFPKDLKTSRFLNWGDFK